MPYCRECGTRIPNDEEAKFCPNCGAFMQAQSQIAKPLEVSWPIERKTSRRIRTIIAAILASLVATSFGAILPINSSEAQGIRNEFGEMEDILENASPFFEIAMIYGNNLMHSLAMFTPFVGPIYGSYVFFSTGRIVAAMASIQGTNTLTLLMLTFVFPHAWIEYLSYGVALSESFWLSLEIFRRRFRDELSNLFKAVFVCALLLLSAALIETSLISFLA